MPFLIVRNDITRMEVDAVVNAAKPSLLGGGGVDGAIHAAAGPELLEACRALGGCPVGEARITPGFRLPARYVIHTVGPRWNGGQDGELSLLLSCYRSSLELAEERNCESVAFPLISSGAYGWPKEEALDAAQEAIWDFLRDHDMTVYLVVYGDEALDAAQKRFDAVREYIDSHYVRAHPSRANRQDAEADYALESACYSAPCPGPAKPAAPKKPRTQSAAKPSAAPKPSAAQAPCLEEEWRFGELDESFQQMLLRKITESGMSDADCYKRANIDRKLFSKIRKDPQYRPSKPTALAFAVALRLDLRETGELLRKAGFALSRSSKFDVIVRYYIERGDYDIFAINETLFAFEQSLLGNLS